MQNQLQEFRCPNCQKLLFKGILGTGTIEIKCKGCKTITTFSDENIKNLQESV